MAVSACTSPSLNYYDTRSSLSQTVVIYLKELTERQQQTSTHCTLKYINALHLQEGIDKIKSFLEMEPGWNGYDAEPIRQDVADNAIRFINELNELPEIFPTGRNSIQFEHFINDDNLVEIEVFADHFECFSITDGMENETSTGDIRAAAQILKAIYG